MNRTQVFSVLPKHHTRELCRGRLRPQDVINLTESRYYLHWYRPLRTIFSNIEPIRWGCPLAQRHRRHPWSYFQIKKAIPIQARVPFSRYCECLALNLHLRDAGCAQKSPAVRQIDRTKNIYIIKKVSECFLFLSISRCSLVFVSGFWRALHVTLKKKGEWKKLSPRLIVTQIIPLLMFFHSPDGGWCVCVSANRSISLRRKDKTFWSADAPLSKERRWVAPNIFYSFMELHAHSLRAWAMGQKLPKYGRHTQSSPLSPINSFVCG